MEYPKFKVTVSCMTYNQSKYITDAMNGFTMQQTSFPFVCTIVDDASTDGEQEVIRKYVEDNFDFSEGSVAFHKETDYAHITYSQHKTNRNCYFAVLYLKENHYSQRKPKMGYLSEWRDMCEYEALCEGDDYWIDKTKLQTQVLFLDEHLDYSVSSHRIKKYDQEEDIYYVDRLDSMFGNNAGITFNNRSKVWIAETSSIVCRISAQKEFLESKCQKRDNVHLYYLLKKGKGYCLSKVMSVYRQHFGGVFAKQDLDSKLINGSYLALKELFEYEHTSDSRFLYYRAYALVFILTRGRILGKEPFSLRKFFSLPYYILDIICMIHPVYKKEK